MTDPSRECLEGAADLPRMARYIDSYVEILSVERRESVNLIPVNGHETGFWYRFTSNSTGRAGDVVSERTGPRCDGSSQKLCAAEDQYPHGLTP